MPAFATLPVIEPLTDPFEWSDGSGRDTSFAGWSCRRAEIKAEIEHYEIGLKPDRPDSITANYSGGTLTVSITVNDSTLILTSAVALPAGEGPFPAVIGMGFGAAGSLPTDIFTSRGIALIPFNFWQVMAHAQTRGKEPINALIPSLRIWVPTAPGPGASAGSSMASSWFHQTGFLYAFAQLGRGLPLSRCGVDTDFTIGGYTIFMLNNLQSTLMSF